MEGVSPIKIDVLKTGPQGSILLDYPVELRKDSLSHQPSFLVSTWNLKIPQCFITQWCSPMFDHPITWLIRYQIITTLGFATWSLKHFFVFCFLGGKKSSEKSRSMTAGKCWLGSSEGSTLWNLLDLWRAIWRYLMGIHWLIAGLFWLNITASWHTLWRENGPVLVILGVCSPQKWSHILIITCWFT